MIASCLLDLKDFPTLCRTLNDSANIGDSAPLTIKLHHHMTLNDSANIGDSAPTLPEIADLDGLITSLFVEKLLKSPIPQ